MEKKDILNTPSPEGGTSADASANAEPDMASYYASAASAASTGYEFHEENTPGNDEAAAPAEDSAHNEESAGEAGSEAQNLPEQDVRDEKAPEQDADAADISDDGSPHGPLNLFAEGAEDKNQDGRKAAVLLRRARLCGLPGPGKAGRTQG